MRYRLHRAGTEDQVWVEPLVEGAPPADARLERAVILALGAEHRSDELPTWLEARITWITDDLREAHVWPLPIVVHGPDAAATRAEIGGVRVLDTATAWTATDRPSPSVERAEVEDAGN